MIRRFLITIGLLLAAAVSWLWISLPDVSSLATKPPKTTAFMEQRKARLRSEGKDDRIDYRWVPISGISPWLRRAVIVSEDSRFYEHEGIDTKELEKVVEESVDKRKITRGGSTITQQLAKNLYLSPSRNPMRKIRELLITWQLERHLTKTRILELYLNVAELGDRTYGAEAAARHYFGKSAAALTPSEAALLAGSLPNPRKMNPGNPNRALRKRQRIILSRMERWGTAAEREALAAEGRSPRRSSPAAQGQDGSKVAPGPPDGPGEVAAPEPEPEPSSQPPKSETSGDDVLPDESDTSPPRYSSTFRSRSAFVMTETELKLIAAAAIIGLSRRPKTG